MPSLPPVSAKLIADAEQFVAEFRRAENQARRSSAQIDREIGDLSKNIQRKLSLSDVGKDILKGAGLFGGFQIAQTASELIVGHFRDTAELAKTIEESTARQLAHVREMVAMRQTPSQQIETLKKQREEAAKELETLQKQEVIVRRIRGREGDVREVPTVVPKSKEQAADIDRLTKSLEDLDKQIQTLTKSQKERAAADVSKESADRVRVLSEQLGIQERAYADLIARQKEKNTTTAQEREEAEKLAQRYLELGDPMARYIRDLKQIAELQSDGKLTFDQAWAAKVETWSKMAEMANKEADGRGTVRDSKEISPEQVQAIRRVDEDLLKANDTAREFGMTFSSAFEDAIVNGGKLSDVLRGLEQDILRLMVRKAITEPLANGVSSFFAATFGGGKALGGATEVGTAYLVGETGPELFAPREAGSIIPAGRTAALLSGAQSGGATFVFSPQIAAGVTRQELSAMMPRMFDQFAAMVSDKVQRGGAYRKAFA